MGVRLVPEPTDASSLGLRGAASGSDGRSRCRQDGIGAPFVLDAPINGHAFETSVAQVLGPERRPGDGGIMVTLSNHKGLGCGI